MNTSLDNNFISNKIAMTAPFFVFIAFLIREQRPSPILSLSLIKKVAPSQQSLELLRGKKLRPSLFIRIKRLEAKLGQQHQRFKVLLQVKDLLRMSTSIGYLVLTCRTMSSALASATADFASHRSIQAAISDSKSS
jgi:hypothetical protein